MARRAAGHPAGVEPGTHRLEARRNGDTVVVAVHGELDMAATFRLEPDFERISREPGVRHLVIDLGGVEFIDSAGLGLLLATHERLRTANVDLQLANPSPSVRRILELTGAGPELPIS
jgi:anti-anti-sigma factor